MKIKKWMAISSGGTVRTRSTRGSLDWNEIGMWLNIDIPNELFKRPHIQADLKIKDVPNVAYDAEIIVNTKELIEQQTGAKIDFRIVREEE